jgi:hypothetical protein
MMSWLAIQAWYGNEILGVYWVARGAMVCRFVILDGADGAPNFGDSREGLGA